MAAEYNQDFVTYTGDDVYPIFTVRDANGTPIDISGVSQITWSVKRLYQDAVAIASMTLSLGQITLIGGGAGGQFQVIIPKATTALLSGYYVHIATLADGLGNITTVEVGRMQVGPKPAWTYDATSILSVPLFQVRRLIGDVIANDPQMPDDEVLFAISLRASIFGAAAECCRMIASQYSRKVDTTSPGPIQTAYSKQAEAYAKQAVVFEGRSKMLGAGATIYAGGISNSDKTDVSLNTDRVSPAFNIGMTDNRFLPVGPVGNETAVLPSPVLVE